MDIPINDPSRMPRINVVIADDHPLVRAGLAYSLTSEPDLAVVGEAANGDDIPSLCQQCQPDVLLLDLRMPGRSALETMAYLREHCPHTKVLMLTAFDDEAHVRGLVDAGVSGYLLKEEAPATVSDAIHAVMKGGAWFSQSVAERLARPTESAALTQREKEVLALLVHGKTNRGIAEELRIAEVTIRFHLRNIYKKVGADSRAQVVRWAMQHGFGE